MEPGVKLGNSFPKTQAYWEVENPLPMYKAHERAKM